MSAAGKRSRREHVLLALFAVSLAWALLLAGAMVMLLVGAERRSGLPAWMEDWAPPVVIAIVAVLVTAFLVRRSPGFLRVPAGVPSLRLSLALIVTVAIVAVAVLGVAFAVTMIIDPPGPHSEDVQHVPLRSGSRR